MIKLKRIFAWIIDWIISGIPALLYMLIFWENSKLQDLNALTVILFMLAFLSYPTLFILRDVMCKGRSIAKRIFGLYIVDIQTNLPPSAKKLILRNAFFLLYPIEAFLLLATNHSLGDSVSGTDVVMRKDIDSL